MVGRVAASAIASASRYAATGRLRCNYAATWLGNRTAYHRCVPRQGLRARGGIAASIRAISVELDARGLAPVMKAAMNLIGIPVGEPFPPYGPLSHDEIAMLAAVLKNTVLAHRLSATVAA
jgi:hypothetical protein